MQFARQIALGPASIEDAQVAYTASLKLSATQEKMTTCVQCHVTPHMLSLHVTRECYP